MRNNGWVALAIAVGIIILSVAVHAAFITFVTPDGEVVEGNLFNLAEGTNVTITGDDASNTVTVGVTGNFPNTFITTSISEPWTLPGWQCDATTQAFGISQNGLLFGLIVPPQTTTYTSIGINVSSAGAGGTVARLGLYKAELTPDGWQPGELILDAGTVSIASTGSKEVAISETLQGGTPYFTAVVHDAAAVSMYTCNQSIIGVMPATGRGSSTSANFRGIGGSTGAVGTGALPNPAPAMNFASFSTFSAIVKLKE